MADLQQEYGFFNYDEAVLESTGKYDRQYTAEDFAKYFALFVGNGVFANPASQLMVKIAATKQTPYNVTVEPGWAFINGYWYHLQQKATLTIPVNTSAQTKYQRVVVRYNNTTREIGLTIVEAAGETIEPTRNDAIYDLALAQVTVKSNASALSASDVKDLRPSSKYCGYVAGAIDQIDAGTLYDNLTEQFNIWFEGIKKQLDGDVATKLQKQIGSLEQLKTTDKTDLVSSVNEVFTIESSNKTSVDKRISELSTSLTNGLKSKEDINAFKKYCPTFGTTYSGVIANALYVDSSSADGALNKVYSVANGATSNMPGNCFFGIREVYYFNQQEIWVKITGVNTEGYMSTWHNRYNGTIWLGWQEQITFNSNKWTTGIKRIGIIPASGQQTAIYDSENWLVFGTGNGITSRSKDSIEVYLPVSGSAFQQVSSKKVKENIKDLSEDEAQKILNVRAVSFDYIEKVGGEKNQRGVIAEEIEKIIPSCVYHDGKYPSVDYTKLIPYLIKIVQIQQKEIEGLKKKVGGNNE